MITFCSSESVPAVPQSLQELEKKNVSENRKSFKCKIVKHFFMINYVVLMNKACEFPNRPAEITFIYFLLFLLPGCHVLKFR